jgi:hypothetical protein
MQREHFFFKHFTYNIDITLYDVNEYRWKKRKNLNVVFGVPAMSDYQKV